MGPLSRWAVNRPWRALGVWLLMAVIIGVAGVRLGGSYNDSFELPDTESAAAQELLSQVPGVEDALTEATVKVVWSPESGSAADPEVEEAATELLTEMAAIPSVTCVVTPYGALLGDGCPDPATQPGAGQAEGGAGEEGQEPGAGAAAPPTAEQAKVLAGIGPAGISVDESVAYASVTFGAPVGEIPLTDVEALLEAAEAANGVDGLQVGASGQALEAAAQEPPASEGIGVAVALLILLFAFGSLIGALLPIGTALLSLALGQALVLVTASYFTVATFAPTLAAMIGLGVGIDYSLFVINRYKQALEAGREPRAAVMESVRTAGRAVLFAAFTVMIALSGLFVIGFDFFNGLAVASIATVAMMLIGATFLLPAILALLGRRAFAVRMPWARKPKVHN
ncbi:MAG: MMPL family transporter, partial [Actinomycetota bacterium]|nr:MMPL family transporter [Actinomycetota bacterium]